MATTINSGLVDTADPLANELKVDMRERVAMLDKDTTQFTTMLMKLPEERANSFKVEWLNDELMPLVSALAASATSILTTLDVTADEGNYFKVGHIVRIVSTGEPVRVTATAASAITVVRAIDGSTAASAASGAKLLIISGSNEQGATAPTALVTERATNYNYTSIIRNNYRFTETVNAMGDRGWYGGAQLARERQKKAIEHKWEIENTLFFGARSYSAGTNNPRHSAGGLLHFVTAESDTDTLDETELQTFFRNGFEYGSSRKVFFCAPLVAQVISSFLEEDIRAKSGETVYGVKVDHVISGITGVRVPVVVKKEWKRYGESAGEYGTYGVLVDMDYVQLAPLRDTQLKRNRQANDADEVMEEYLTEVSLKVERPEVHRWLVDVTGAA